MDAAFTAEQDEIRRTLRELMAKRAGPDEVKAAARTPAGHDEELWRTLAARLGLPGLALDEEHGGVGCTATELALACEETGRVLLPSPLLATAALALPLIRRLGTEEQRAALLPRIAQGELTAALAVPGSALATALGLAGANQGDWAGGGRAGGVQARCDEEGWRLYGQAEQVLDGHSADLLLVAAHTGGFARSRALLFLVRADSAGVVRVRQTTLDETRPQARVELRDAEAELLGPDDAGTVAEALAATGNAAAAVLAAEAVGAADRALERTVEYAKQREQFGRAIGSFQAVKHRLADVYVAVQAARSAAYYAAWAAAREDGIGVSPARAESRAWGRVGGLALAQALDALRTAAGEAIQLHGGIGFTWEHEAHLYFKRAASDELLFGPVHRLRAHAADHAGLFLAEAEEVAV
ncbi:acyl-CoA dehydrogenase family protein [Streptomyces sp. TRM66268-LWL]|uniref:Acyl-CoA dehydrogenase family protein n=1 Tax=Streptomyces polyasparticus TaxID=2767826 RepID=A0ABR7SLK9_9ACTN|nr:acyl-CoA dehydrogenase family protein [Streptomyces polyasparticus]MBC9716376.1 acyl-CoA dehydrogenase family protein [Streptomyces polyasparticus]